MLIRHAWCCVIATVVLLSMQGCDQSAATQPVSHVEEASQAPNGSAHAKDTAPHAAPRSARQSPIPPALLEGTAQQRRRFDTLQRNPPPALDVTTWLNSEPLMLTELKGTIVVLDFWGVWCPPCLAAIPKLNELQAKYGAQGVIFIGVCHSRQGEFMGDVVRQRDIAYPVCLDRDNATSDTYLVDGFPDYFIINRAGELRIADCSNEHLESAVKRVLAEDDGEAQP